MDEDNDSAGGSEMDEDDRNQAEETDDNRLVFGFSGAIQSVVCYYRYCLVLVKVAFRLNRATHSRVYILYVFVCYWKIGH